MTGRSFQSAWAAKKVEKRMAIAAPSSALAVVAYLRAAFNSQVTRRVIPVRRPIAIRTVGLSHPCWIE